METLNIDIETHSDEDLTKVGIYKYAGSPNPEILPFTYSVGGQPVEYGDLTISEVPNEIMATLTDKNVLKIVFSTQFERVCLSKYLGIPYCLDLAQRHCTMVHANELGLLASLGQCTKYLNIEQRKDARGAQLTNFFSKPCKPTKKNGVCTRNLPEHAPEKWQTFVEYCIQGVNIEIAVANKLNRFPAPEGKWRLYTLDQRANDRRAEIGHGLTTAAIDTMANLNEAELNEMEALTGPENSNSLAQLKEWLKKQRTSFEKLGRGVVLKALALGNLLENVAKVLELHLSLSNSSTEKYLVTDNTRCSDNRICGIL